MNTNTNYGMEIVRATEIAALTAARIQGLGNYLEVLNETRQALIKVLDRLPIRGRVVNDRFVGRKETVQLPASIGCGETPFDIMAIALEGYHSAADGKNNSTSYAVIAEPDTIQSVPNLSMYKMVVGQEVGRLLI